MSGYAASARIVRATPHLAQATRDRVADLRPVGLAATVVETDPSSAAGGNVAVRRAEMWTAFRERWSQLTFYLFDAESWR